MVKEYKDEENTAIAEIKKRMKEIISDDSYVDDKLLYRFLKARDFVIDDAEKMLKEHLEWRKKYDVANALTWKHSEVVEKYFSLNKICYDKEGNVVVYIPSGTIDWIGLFESSKLQDTAKYLIQFIEDIIKDLKNENKKDGKNAVKQFYIHNMENLSFTQATNKKVILNTIFFFHLYLNNYPETLKLVYIINASMHFHMAFSILQKFLPSTVLEKIKVYSDESWKDDLLKIVDAEVLPAFLGGKRTDPDGNPLCSTFIKHGEPVPQKYYIHRSKRSLASIPGVQRLTLPRAAFREIPVEVEELGSYLEWEFETESRDVGFGLFHEDEEGTKVEIVPLQRINTDEYSETGLYKCEKVGKYIVIFDNTYSIIRKKEIFYKIKVKKQSEEESDLDQSNAQNV